jgi:hypothetical protein
MSSELKYHYSPIQYYVLMILKILHIPRLSLISLLYTYNKVSYSQPKNWVKVMVLD